MLALAPPLVTGGLGGASGFVLGFGLGGTMAMSAFAAAIGTAADRLSRIEARALAFARLLSMAAIGVGVWWVFFAT